MALDLEAARRRAAAKGIVPAKAEPVVPQDDYADVIPRGEDLRFAHADEEDQQIDSVIDRIDIIAAYKIYCGKMTPVVGSRRESIMISCPKPTHRDENPSAWINLDKDIWFCAGCEEGGDKFDIAAYNLHFPVPGYKQGKTFHDLRRAMVEKAGYKVSKPLGAKTERVTAVDPSPELLVPVQVEPNTTAKPPSLADFMGAGRRRTVATTGPAPDPAPAAPDAPPVATPAPADADTAVVPPSADVSSAAEAVVTPIPTDAHLAADIASDDDSLENFQYPTIDWKKVVPTDTFLYKYMECTSPDDIPVEYHFWLGLTAIGLALGRETLLHDVSPVNGNLFICTIGKSGSGKSQALRYLDQLMHQALPFDWEDPTTRGVRVIPTPGSGEQLIASFQRELPLDPSLPKKLTIVPVKGIVEFSEFGDLVTRTGRVGSNLGYTLMHFYDCKARITTASRTSGELMAIDAFASAVSTTQLKSIKLLMTSKDAGSGFLNRWVFVMGPPVDRQLFKDVEISVDPSVPFLKGIVSWSAGKDRVRVSKPAIALLADWWKRVAEPYKLKDQTDMLSRMDLLIKKLILLFAANSHEREASVRTVQSVIDLFPYLLQSYNAVAERVGSTEENELVDKITVAVEGFTAKYGDPPTLRQIQQRMTKGKYDPHALKKMIDTLVALEQLEIIDPPAGKRGPKSVRYKKVTA